jgi:hypothetical protein
MTGRSGLVSCEMMRFRHRLYSRHTNSGKAISLTRRLRFNTRYIFWYSFLLAAEKPPGIWCSRKNQKNLRTSMISLGLEPATFRLVAWRLNYLGYRLPPISHAYTYILSHTNLGQLPKQLDHVLHSAPFAVATPVNLAEIACLSTGLTESLLPTPFHFTMRNAQNWFSGLLFTE